MTQTPTAPATAQIGSISARVVEHSRNPATGIELFTLQVTYPRMIHAEAKTHRVLRIDGIEYEVLEEVGFMDDENLSRNASSSRATPIEKMIQMVIDNPAMPIEWGSNKPGMQAGSEISSADQALAKMIWLEGRDDAVKTARRLNALGLHKQIVNRVLETYGHITVIVSATRWDNFFTLRCHEAADPTMRALATCMRTAMAQSFPMTLEGSGDSPMTHDWHLPYVSMTERATRSIRECLALSVARCARVSYLNHDGSKPDPEKDLALARRLFESKHLSPFEHQASVVPGQTNSGNFHGGFVQYRQIVEHDPEALLLPIVR